MSKFNNSKVNISQCSCVGNSQLNDRYSLTLALHNLQHCNHKTAIVILKNPATTAKSHVFYNVSFQDIVDVDRTTTRVINVLHRLGYQKIITINIFPYFNGNAQVLNTIYPLASLGLNISYHNNLKEIKNILNNNKGAEIIGAWGQKSVMRKSVLDKGISDVLSIITNLGLSNNLREYTRKTGLILLTNSVNYPLHGQRW